MASFTNLHGPVEGDRTKPRDNDKTLALSVFASDRHGLYPGCSTGIWITTMQAKCLLRIAKCHLAGKAYVEPAENLFQGSCCN